MQRHFLAEHVMSYNPMRLSEYMPLDMKSITEAGSIEDLLAIPMVYPMQGTNSMVGQNSSQEKICLNGRTNPLYDNHQGIILATIENITLYPPM